MLETIDAANDQFIRTTDADHIERVQEFWRRLHDAGDVYEGRYEGPVLRRLRGVQAARRPRTARTASSSAGSTARRSRRSARPTTSSRLSSYADRLLELYESQPDFVQPESARNEVISFVKQGLQDLSISRSTFDWGIPVPWDE